MTQGTSQLTTIPEENTPERETFFWIFKSFHLDFILSYSFKCGVLRRNKVEVFVVCMGCSTERDKSLGIPRNICKVLKFPRL